MAIKLEDINEFQNLGLLAKQLVEGFITGLHKSPYHGFSVEFAEHKLYNYGESTKNVDWKVFARTDKLFTKQYEEETNLRAHILLDISGSMFYPKKNMEKIKYATLGAASVAYLLNAQRDAVGLTTFSDAIEYQSPLKSTRANLNLILTELSNIQESQKKGRTDVSKVLHEIADKIQRRSLVVLFSDMFQRPEDLDAIFSALQHLKHNKHEVILFHIADHATELDFNFDDRPYNFIDLETRESVKINPGDVKELYTSKVNDYYYNLKIRCGQYKIDFVKVDINDSFDKILGAFLIKRKRMS